MHVQVICLAADPESVMSRYIGYEFDDFVWLEDQELKTVADAKALSDDELYEFYAVVDDEGCWHNPHGIMTKEQVVALFRKVFDMYSAVCDIAVFDVHI